jgi:hypothetical protein
VGRGVEAEARVWRLEVGRARPPLSTR